MQSTFKDIQIEAKFDIYHSSKSFFKNYQTKMKTPQYKTKKCFKFVKN